MNTSLWNFTKLIVIVSFFAGIASCKSDLKKSDEFGTTQTDSIIEKKESIKLKPSGEKPVWAPTITSEMQVVIEKLIALGGKPIETLDAKEARMQPTPTDAVVAVMKENNIPVVAAQCDTIGKKIPITGGQTNIRIYTPKNATGPFPVIVYYHGGGFVIADIDVYNSSAAGLCEQVKAIVVSVEYPKGPEKKFPAAQMVSFDAYKWVLKNAKSFNGDASKVAVVGESAGGNLAANVCIMARDQKIQMPLYQVLVYPIANNDLKSESYIKYAEAKPLRKAMMQWFIKNALATSSQAADSRFSLVNANLKNLPQTLVIGAEICPLQTEGKLLAEKLKAANIPTEYKLYTGVVHEFFGMASIIPEAKEAQTLASERIKKAFGI